MFTTSQAPDSDYAGTHVGSAPVLNVGEQLSHGEPPTKKTPGGETNPRGPKTSGLFRLFARIQNELRTRCGPKRSGRRGVCAMAVGRFSKLASWIHGLWLARKPSVDGPEIYDLYNTLHSDEEWSTSLTAAEVSLQGTTIFKDVAF
ncbi:hypothetical protein V5799_019078 [Amblyomma americanum]|uniref:Uncharacterized protein n=1 Tax=Amblyomma americanum TaxID=6943 RepID=A0AAQ4E0Z8_AMBAM